MHSLDQTRRLFVRRNNLTRIIIEEIRHLERVKAGWGWLLRWREAAHIEACLFRLVEVNEKNTDEIRIALREGLT